MQRTTADITTKTLDFRTIEYLATVSIVHTVQKCPDLKLFIQNNVPCISSTVLS